MYGGLGFLSDKTVHFIEIISISLNLVVNNNRTKRTNRTNRSLSYGILKPLSTPNYVLVNLYFFGPVVNLYLFKWTQKL